MTEIQNRDLLEKAARRIIHLEQKLAEEIERKNEPIAIVSMGCRFPGAPSIEDFWSLLNKGGDAITTVPPGRWKEEEYKNLIINHYGAFLDDIDQFDADFFNISPNEARLMDPQQRLLQEVVWETLERANIAPQRLKKSRTGTFIGICTSDYALRTIGLAGDGSVNAYFGTGNALSVAAGRIAYSFGFNGPAMSIETACSSSLVATHLAIQSLRSGECDMAIAGGVNLIMAPYCSMAFSQAHMLAADGKCKTFDQTADGYVRGEGCGIILLCRRSFVEEKGLSVLAEILGSAINQDGASGSLTAPSGLAQRAVIESAQKSAGVGPSDIGVIEAHGTGTFLGDKIELEALHEVFGKDKRTSPLYISSLKTNMGHLEAAAGVAGIIKTVLSLKQKKILPHINFKKPGHPSLTDGAIMAVPVETQDWKEHFIGGISSFGFSGTNAHVIIRGTREEDKKDKSSESFPILVLSAKSPARLKALLEKYLNEDFTRADYTSVCYTAAKARNHYAFRFAIMAESWEEAERLIRSRLSDSQEFLACEKVTQVQWHYPTILKQLPIFPRFFLKPGSILRGEIEVVDAVLAGLNIPPLLPLFLSERPVSIEDERQARAVAFVSGLSMTRMWNELGIRAESFNGIMDKVIENVYNGELSYQDALETILSFADQEDTAPFLSMPGFTDVNPLNIFETLTSLYNAGASIEWEKLNLDIPFVDIPLTPFLRKKYWINEVSSWKNINYEEREKTYPVYQNKWKKISSEEGDKRRYLVIGEKCAPVIKALAENTEHDFVLHEIVEGKLSGALDVIDAIEKFDGCLYIPDQTKSSQDAETISRIIQHIQIFLRNRDVKLWIVTSGVATGFKTSNISEHNLAYTAISGIARTLEVEMPEQWGGVIDLPDQPSQDDFLTLTHALINEEKHLAIRDGQLYASRIAGISAPESRIIRISPEYTYVITGGLGEIGIEAAKWLIKKGARHLTLVSRKKRPEFVFSDKGMEDVVLNIVEADISNESDVERLFREIDPRNPLGGIIHAAGVSNSKPLLALSDADINDMMQAKVGGGQLLYKYANAAELQFFISFSSISSVWGAKDIAHYAAANAYIDGLANLFSTKSVRGISINWSPWNIGMVPERMRKAFASIGMKPLSPESAFETLDMILNSDLTQATIADVDWEKYLSLITGDAARPLFRNLLSSGNDHLSKKPIIEVLSESVATVLGHDPMSIDINAGFADIGLDSIGAMDLIESINKRLSLQLPITVLFNYPSIQKLAQYLNKDSVKKTQDSLLLELEELEYLLDKTV